MKYYFFVTNVKTQTFYRIVQFFCSAFGDLEDFFFPFRRKVQAVCQCSIRSVCCALITVSNEYI